MLHLDVSARCAETSARRIVRAPRAAVRVCAHRVLATGRLWRPCAPQEAYVRACMCSCVRECVCVRVCGSNEWWTHRAACARHGAYGRTGLLTRRPLQGRSLHRWETTVRVRARTRTYATQRWLRLRSKFMNCCRRERTSTAAVGGGGCWHAAM